MYFNNNNSGLKAMQQQQLMKALQEQSAMQQFEPQYISDQQQAAINKVRKEPKTRRDVYLEIRITNPEPNAVQVLLFDAIQAYGLQNGDPTPASVTIEETTKSGLGSAGYQLLLNRLVAGSTFYFNLLKMEFTNQSQVGRPISIYEDSQKANNVILRDTIYPSRGRNSMQQQLNLIEIPYNYKISSSSAFLLTLEPNSTLFLRMFASEEIITNA